MTRKTFVHKSSSDEDYIDALDVESDSDDEFIDSLQSDSDQDNESHVVESASSFEDEAIISDDSEPLSDDDPPDRDHHQFEAMKNTSGDLSEFNVASTNDKFIDSLHTDVSHLYTYDAPKPMYKDIMTTFGSAYFVEKFEMRSLSTLHNVLESDKHKPSKWKYWLTTPSAFSMRIESLLKS